MFLFSSESLRKAINFNVIDSKFKIYLSDRFAFFLLEIAIGNSSSAEKDFLAFSTGLRLTE